MEWIIRPNKAGLADAVDVDVFLPGAVESHQSAGRRRRCS